MSHDSANKNLPSKSTSSRVDGGYGNEMDEDDASQGKTLEQEDPGYISPSNIPKPTQEAHKNPDIVAPLINIEHISA